MAYRIAVLDDDAVLLKQVCHQAEMYAHQHEVECVFLPFSSSYDVEPFYFDAYLLDISMPEMDGIQLAMRIRRSGSMSPIIFISGIEARVFEALRTQPLRFIRKSHMKEELPEAMDALFEQFRIFGSDTLIVTTNRSTMNIPVHKILYVESFDKMQRVVTDETNYDVYSSMQFFEKELTKRNFFRIHRSYLVNMSAVLYIQKQEAAMRNGIKLPISRFKVEDAKERLTAEVFRA